MQVKIRYALNGAFVLQLSPQDTFLLQATFNQSHEHSFTASFYAFQVLFTHQAHQWIHRETMECLTQICKMRIEPLTSSMFRAEK